ncbi:MAG TPA: hypothetical protein VGD45_20395 [Steroidobacter sp.]|uniref:hypothetical protein n=1 Tax=Steroidobacter sp. TaxID=1978227 RepID=UPI002ED98D4E
MNKSPGQIAYEQELLVKPNYHDGTPRKAWDQLKDFAQISWEQDPTPRYRNVAELRAFKGRDIQAHELASES